MRTTGNKRLSGENSIYSSPVRIETSCGCMRVQTPLVAGVVKYRS